MMKSTVVPAHHVDLLADVRFESERSKTSKFHVKPIDTVVNLVS